LRRRLQLLADEPVEQLGIGEEAAALGIE